LVGPSRSTFLQKDYATEQLKPREKVHVTPGQAAEQI
jgi:hypothetical protein